MIEKMITILVLPDILTCADSRVILNQSSHDF